MLELRMASSSSLKGELQISRSIGEDIAVDVTHLRLKEVADSKCMGDYLADFPGTVQPRLNLLVNQEGLRCRRGFSRAVCKRERQN